MPELVRPVITGVGVVAPTGSTFAQHWTSVCAGRNRLEPLRHFDAGTYAPQLAGHVTDPTLDEQLPPRLRVQTDRVTKMSLVATAQALSDAGLSGEQGQARTFGVVTALSAGGFEFGEGELRNLWRKGGSWVTAYQAFAWFYAVNTGQISIANDCRGPSSVTANEHDGGLIALDLAQRSISSGTPGIVLGGFDATLSSWGVTARESDPDVCHPSRPEHGYTPWGLGSSGYAVGEGGAVLVLEDPAACRLREGVPLARVDGVALARRMSEETLAATITRCVLEACETAGLAPRELSLVLADGMGLGHFDRPECVALGAVLPGTPVSIPKRGTGRLLAGGAALDLATATASITHSCLPPTPGPRYPTLAGTELVWEPTPADVRHVLVVATDPRGTTSAAVISRARP